MLSETNHLIGGIKDRTETRRNINEGLTMANIITYYSLEIHHLLTDFNLIFSLPILGIKPFFNIIYSSPVDL